MKTDGFPSVSTMGDTGQKRNAPRREHPAEMDHHQVVMPEIPRILRNKHLKCLQHTPESAQILHDNGFFANGKEMSHQVEQHLFDAFIEDDYDGHLHLMTLHSVVESSQDVNCVSFRETGDDIDISSSFDNDLLGPALGIVFWRDVPDEETKEWFDWNYVAKVFSQDKPIKNGKIINTKDSLTSIGRDETLHLVRQSSIRSIKNMVKDM